MKKIYDLSLPINIETVVYPGDPSVRIKQISAIEQGAAANISLVTLNTHTATHIDAPLHIYNDGPGADQIPLENLIGPASVFEIPAAPVIELHHLLKLSIKPGSRVLFKTANSALYREHEFNYGYTYISTAVAKHLADIGVKLVGIDYYSIDPPEGTLAAHRIFLRREISIIEGINLSGVTPGEYELICLPLKITGADGSPCRVILREL